MPKHLSLGTLLLGFIVVLAACSTTHCPRKDKIPKLPSQSPILDKHGQLIAPSDEPKKIERRVYVFKYDGSRQCGQGTVILPKRMARELNGIKLYSQESKNDGLMHVQVCGAPTGKANVYEIDESQLDKAKKRGFQQWNFD